MTSRSTAPTCPRPDLITYWLADRIDQRGWGLDGDSFAAMDMLRELGVDVWFNLGDRDLALCIERRAADRPQARHRPQALARLTASIGIRSSVLPMCDEPVRTQVKIAGLGWLPFQEFMIRERAAGPSRTSPSRAPSTHGLESGGRGDRGGRRDHRRSLEPDRVDRPDPRGTGMREALADASAPVVAVSPIVGGEVLKGPTATFMAWAGQPATSAGVAEHYGALLDGLVSDRPVDGLATPRLRGADGRCGRPRASPARRSASRVASRLTVGARSPRPAVRTAAVLPVKRLPLAKSRLGGTLGADDRRELALAMAGDVVAALARARDRTDRVVSSEPAAARSPRQRRGRGRR